MAEEYLLGTDVGAVAAELFAGAELIAPELLDAETMAAIRKEVIAGRVGRARARQAVEDLIRWPVRRYPHRQLLLAAWGMRDNVTAYDALYVALAISGDAALVTADGALARAPLPVPVYNLRA